MGFGRAQDEPKTLQFLVGNLCRAKPRYGVVDLSQQVAHEGATAVLAG